MSNSIDEFVTLLEANGFAQKRTNGKHEIWSDGVENFALPTGTVKSHRMHDYLRSELRKKVKGRRDFIDWDDLTKGKKMFNTPRIKIEENIVDKGDWKLLDDDALHFCTEAAKEKKSQQWMAESLNALGYRGKRGGKILQGDVSNFMIEHGHRKLKDRKANLEVVPEKPTITIDLHPDQFEAKSTETKKDPVIDQPTRPQPECYKSQLLDDVRSILGSNLSEELKEKVIRNFLK